MNKEPLVLEAIKLHESLLDLGIESMRWGDYITAKNLIIEVNFHS